MKRTEIDAVLKDEEIQMQYLDRELNDFWRQQHLIKRLKRKGFLLGVPLLRAWVPYILIGIVLALTRVWAALKPDSWAGAMKNVRLSILNPNGEQFWGFAFLWNPGVIFILVGLLSILFPFRKRYIK